MLNNSLASGSEIRIIFNASTHLLNRTITQG
jgi:hypothetical protein